MYEDTLTPAEWLEVEEAAPPIEEQPDEDDTEDEPGSDNQPGQDDNFTEDEPIEEPKYELTEETMTVAGTMVHRIRALRSFGNVAEGDYGGWVEKESNLSHEGTCWIYDNAKVFDSAYIGEDAQVRDEAIVCGLGSVRDRAKVLGQAWVCGSLYNSAVVRDTAVVDGDDTTVSGCAIVYGNAFVKDAIIRDYVCIKENPVVIGPTLNDHVIVDGTAIAVHEGTFDGVCTRLSGDTRLVESNTLHKYLPDRVLVSTNEIRCLLQDVYVTKQTGGLETLSRDADDPNVFHLTVEPNRLIGLTALPLDPTAKCEFWYRDTTHTNAIDCMWDDVMIGQADQITLVVTNDHCGSASHTYLINIDIAEGEEE